MRHIQCKYLYSPCGGETVPQSLSVTPKQTIKHPGKNPVQPQVIHITDPPDPLKYSSHIGANNVYHLENRVLNSKLCTY